RSLYVTAKSKQAGQQHPDNGLTFRRASVKVWHWLLQERASITSVHHANGALPSVKICYPPVAHHFMAKS
ncbi:MAG: hypothetical protein RR610_21520, partial [Citrobacter sp.]